MTDKEFLYLIELKKEFEFKFKGEAYNLTYGTDNQGVPVIVFGKIYEGKYYYSVKDLLNNAKVDNHRFKEIIEDL